MPEPPEVDWKAMSIVVNGREERFEMCDLGDGFWAAIGRLPDADVTIGSCGVPIEIVRLERIARHERRAVPMPDLAGSALGVARDLDSRFARVPFGRVRRMGDYWALHAIEANHIARLARRYRLETQDQTALEAHWLARIDGQLAPVLDRLEDRDIDFFHRPWLLRRLQWNFVFQLWFNTVGPGGRTWFGNRYAGIRPYTFRMRWRS